MENAHRVNAQFALAWVRLNASGAAFWFFRHNIGVLAYLDDIAYEAFSIIG